jgi:hypothetical protein
MNSLKELLIPTASAQSFDAFAQPTFGPINVGTGNTTTGTVLITTDKTASNIGDIITATISVNTNDIAISEYRIVLNFDPTKFTVIDSDPNTPGTQVTLLDPVFQIENPETENTVNSLGQVLVIAKNTDQVSVNRNVIEIQLQAQSSGNTNISVVTQGEIRTQLVREAGVGLAYTGNSVDIGIETQSGNGGTNGGNGGQQPQTPGTNGGTGSIPDTAVPEYVSQAFPLLAGSFLLLLGAILVKNSKKNPENTSQSVE